MSDPKLNFNSECWELSYSVCFRIPYKNGKGFMVSCTGGHHMNSAGALLSDLLYDKKYIDEGKGNFCDIDGYLSISIKGEYSVYPSKMVSVVGELQEIIKEVFPHVKGFAEECTL